MEILKEEEELHLSEMTAKIISSRITVVPLILVKECQDTWFQLLQKALMNLVLDMGIWGTAQNVPFYEQVQIWQNLSTIFFFGKYTQSNIVQKVSSTHALDLGNLSIV